MNCYQKFYTNQIHSSSLLCQLATMWKSQVLCDAIIKSGSVLIKAHRVVLVAACPMLQSMENAAVGSHLEVRLASDIKQGSINTFLQYLYEGFMMLTEENCKDVEKIARLLQVDSVIKCCADFYKCLGSKTGNSELSDQYKYTFHDMVEFRHVRSSDMQKTYQDRMMKRGPDFNRPSSPTSKRKKIYRPSSPHTISHAPDDTITMSHGYGNVSPNPWERVSWSQSSRRSNFGSTQPGVIDIVEDSLELVQTNPNLKGKKDGKPQESVSVGVASHINSSSEVQIVDIAEPKGSKTVSSSNSSGINTLSQNHMSLSSEGLAESSPLSERVSDRQPSPANQEPVDKVQSGQFSGSSHRSEIDISNSFSRSSESHMYSSPLLSLPHTRLMPSSKSFATGSASQSALPHGQRVSGSQPPPLSRGPKFTQYDSGRSENIDGVPDKKQDNSGDQIPNDAVSDKPPDLSIVKIEAVDNTGCLDMSVDTPHSVEHEDGSETEHDQSSEWIREEMSNEGSNVSTDQNSSWYLGQPQGKGEFHLYTEEASPSIQGVYQAGDNHKLVHIKGIKRACAYCSMQRVKYKSGWSIKSYFKCEACDVPLCKASKDCFEKYHEIRQTYPNLTPVMLKREWKAMSRLVKPTMQLPTEAPPLEIIPVKSGKQSIPNFQDINPWF